MTSLFFNNFFEQLGKGNIDLDGNTIKAMLVTTVYTPNQDTHAFRSDIDAISGAEASGTGYTAGGQAVNNVTVTQDDTNNRANVDFDNETFSAVSVTNVKGYVLYKDTGVAATDILIAFIEFTEGAQSTVAGDFTIIPPAGGAFSIG
jgi:hypothetical protein